jgi:hypothetical protein
MLCVNIALVDTTEANGSIELWPGTHRDPSLPVSDAHHQFADVHVRERTQQVPPVRGNTRKGSILVRDPRLWHRGTTNHSESARIMLTLMYEAEGVQVREPRCAAPRFHRSCCAALAWDRTLAANVEFSDDDERHTNLVAQENVAPADPTTDVAPTTLIRPWKADEHTPTSKLCGMVKRPGVQSVSGHIVESTDMKNSDLLLSHDEKEDVLDAYARQPWLVQADIDTLNLHTEARRESRRCGDS